MKILTARGRELVDRAFLSGEVRSLPIQPEHVGELPGEADLGLLAGVLTSLAGGGPISAKVDLELAPLLHQHLPLDRRTAAEAGVWHHLAAVQFPDFVRLRWSGSTGLVNKERFLGSMKRNAFARLWWGAELTVQPGPDYSLTRLLFRPGGGQDLFEQVMGRRFSNHPPAAAAFLRVMHGRPRRVVRTAAEIFSQQLSTFVLEAMDEDDIEELLQGTLAVVERRSASLVPA